MKVRAHVDLILEVEDAAYGDDWKLGDVKRQMREAALAAAERAIVAAYGAGVSLKIKRVHDVVELVA